MYTHQVHKTPKPIKFHWEWGALIALLILGVVAVYFVTANTQTTQSAAPAMVNKPVQSKVMDASTRGVMGYIYAHHVASHLLKDPAMVGIMGYISAHEVDPFSRAIVTEPAAKSVLDYLRAHEQLP